MLFFSNFNSGSHFKKQFSLSLSEWLANKKMIEKERKNKHLTWLGIQLSSLIPSGGTNFD
jgi:hypothetical protein